MKKRDGAVNFSSPFPRFSVLRQPRQPMSVHPLPADQAIHPNIVVRLIISPTSFTSDNT
jgi:hypothetical protein